MTDVQTKASSVFQKAALSWLLGVCVLLAIGLGVTATLSYRAAERAAHDVLFARAAELGASFAGNVQLVDLKDGDELGRIIADLVGDAPLAVAVFDREGNLIVSRGEAPSRSELLSNPLLRRDLRLSGQVQRLDSERQQLVYWRPLAHRPRRGWRRFWADSKTPWPNHVSPPPPPPPRHRWRRGGPRHILRIAVPFSAADSLLSPARTTLFMSLGGSALLLIVAMLLYRAARRSAAAQRELQRRRALSALGEMAAVLAHEIRTPLAAVKGNAQLISETIPDDNRASSIVDEASRLERLVNGLLDYAQPGEPRRQPCDPDAIANHAAEIVAPKAQASDVNLMVEPAACGECLQADPDQLLQVLVNLLSNAVDATAEEATETDRNVVLRVKRGIGKVVFSVLDRGKGFGDKPLEKLVRPFFSTKQQGTGLGLSIARQIVDQHGGVLQLQDRAGPVTGARVSVSLPTKAGVAQGKENAE